MNMITPPKPSPLGRGLSALFGDTDASYQPPVRQNPPAPAVVTPQATPQTTPPHYEMRSLRRMPIDWLEPGMFQPRRHFDEEAIKGLADSIRERGVLEPLLVRPIKNRDRCEIVAGERRWRAAQLAGAHDVPVLVRDMTDREALEFGIIENVQRQDLSPLEEAEGYKRLMGEFQHTQENLAKIIGKSRAHIGNMMRILDMPDAVKLMLEKGELTFGHVRAIAASPQPTELATIIVKKGLNVRQAEKLAQHSSESGTKQKNASGDASADQQARTADILMLEKDLQRHTGYKIHIHDKDGSGTLTLHYEGMDQLDAILAQLKKEWN